jgi:hypothetical protein
MHLSRIYFHWNLLLGYGYPILGGRPTASCV